MGFFRSLFLATNSLSNSFRNRNNHNVSRECPIPISSENEEERECYTKEVFEQTYFNASYFDSSPKLKNFLNRTVNWKTLHYPLLLKKADEGMIELMSETEVNLAFDEVRKLFTKISVDNYEPKDVKMTPFEDFKKNGSIYVWEYIHKKAEIIFETFWSIQKTQNDLETDFIANLKTIYLDNDTHNNLEAKWVYLEYKLIVFLVKEYKKEQNKTYRMLILKILRSFCLELKVPSKFSHFLNEINLDKSENLANPNDICLKKYDKSIINLGYVAEMAFFIQYSPKKIHSMFFNIETRENLHKKTPKSVSSKYQISNFHFFFTVFREVFQNFKNHENLHSESSYEIEIARKYKLLLVIAQIISIKQFVLKDVISSLKELKKEDSDVNNNEKCFNFTRNYILCHHKMILFLIIYDNLPEKFRDFCLHASINTIKEFKGVKSNFTYSERSNYDDILVNLREDLLLMFQDYNFKIIDNLKLMINLSCTKGIPKSLTLNVFNTLSTIAIIRSEIQIIFKCIFLSFKEKFPKYIETQKEQNKLSNDSCEKNKIICKKNIFKIIFYCYDKYVVPERSQWNILILLNIFMKALLNPKINKITDKNLSGCLSIFNEFFTENQFKMLSYDFGNAENLYAYDILYSEIGKMFIKHSRIDSDMKSLVEEMKKTCDKSIIKVRIDKSIYVLNQDYDENFLDKQHIFEEIFFIDIIYKNIKMEFETCSKNNFLHELELRPGNQYWNYFDGLKILFDLRAVTFDKIATLSHQGLVYVTEINFQKNGLVLRFIFLTNKIDEIQSIGHTKHLYHDNVIQNAITLDDDKYKNVHELIHWISKQISTHEYNLESKNIYFSQMEDGRITIEFIIVREENIKLFDSTTKELPKMIKKLKKIKK